MTGNTVLLGIAIAARFGVVPGSLGIGPPLIAIVAFISGAIVAVPIFPSGFDARRAAAVVLAEGGLVAIASLTFSGFHGDFAVPICIVLVSFSMGAQSVVALKAGLPGISTTYVTGTLVTAIARGFYAGTDEPRRLAAHDAFAWFAYLGGATGGTLLLLTLHHAALVPAAVLLGALAPWIVKRSDQNRFPE